MNSRKGMNGAKATLGNLIASYWFYLFFAFAIIGLSVSSVADGVVQTSVVTDKTDYGPEETVQINGSGFNASSILSLTVEWPDGYLYSANPTTDPDGFFTHDYSLLDSNRVGELGGIDGYYFLSANDGLNYAENLFTDWTLNTFEDSGYSIKRYLFLQ